MCIRDRFQGRHNQTETGTRASPGPRLTIMNTGTVAGDTNGKPSSPSTHAGGTPSARRGTFAHRGLHALADLPKRIDEQLRTHPYRLLGMACAVGVGAGM